MVTPQNLQDKLQSIDSSSVQELWEKDRIQFIDVREPSEYAGERISGAISRPLSRFNPDDFLPDRTKPFILYCETGNRSATAAQKLFLAGFEEVTHLGGGLEEWKQQGYPTHVNPKAPISLMRQVQIVAGSLVLTGTLLGVFVAPGFLFLSGFVGAGLMFAGMSNTCMMAQLLAKLPYNQRV